MQPHFSTAAAFIKRTCSVTLYIKALMLMRSLNYCLIHHSACMLVSVRGSVPHWTALCCAGVSIRCPPWCPRSALCSTPPPSGPDPGGLFRWAARTEDQGEISRGKEKRRQKSDNAKRESEKVRDSENGLVLQMAARTETRYTPPGAYTGVMDMRCDSICCGK